jgi:hypothetical protein
MEMTIRTIQLNNFGVGMECQWWVLLISSINTWAQSLAEHSAAIIARHLDLSG